MTADHGNADDMVQRAKKTNEPLKNEKGELQLLTSHTLVRRTPCDAPWLCLANFFAWPYNCGVPLLASDVTLAVDSDVVQDGEKSMGACVKTACVCAV